MTLWNIIYDFFEQYVFGSSQFPGNRLVSGFISDVGDYTNTYTCSFYVPVNGYDASYEGVVSYMCLGDWLCTTSTIITLVGLFIAITLLIISLFKWIVRLVSLRG